MNKKIFSNPVLVLALSALLPACVTPVDPDAGEDPMELTDDAVGVEAEEEAEGSDEVAPEGAPEEGERAGESEKASGGPAEVLTPYTWTSVYTGGYGGGSFTLSCLDGEIATGIFGRSGSMIDQLGLLCTQLNPDNSFGAVTWRGPVGGGGGDFFVSACPTNHAIRGLEGRSGSYINQLRIKCDTLPGTWILYTGPTFGGNGGSPFGYTAPSRYFLTRIVGRSGDLIDGFYSRFNYVAP